MSEEVKFYIKEHPRLENTVELIIMAGEYESDSHIFQAESLEEAKSQAIDFLKRHGRSDVHIQNG